jgi:hypothetical protein
MHRKTATQLEGYTWRPFSPNIGDCPAHWIVLLAMFENWLSTPDEFNAVTTK